MKQNTSEFLANEIDTKKKESNVNQHTTMKYEELAFLNQQLAVMLKSGIPLEGALRQLCANMQDSQLRSELQKLEADLAKGTPLSEALAARRLPEFYVQMIQVGVRSNDLPGVLTLVADYYSRMNSVWTRLKGLMVYPVIVLLAALALSLGFSLMLGVLTRTFYSDFGLQLSTPMVFQLWLLPVLFFSLLLAVVAILAVPRFRRSLRWRLPGFKEASISQLASAFGLLLRGGSSLRETLGLMLHLENESRVKDELTLWQKRLAGGHGTFSELAAGGKVVPPLFVWLVANGGEDLAAGFNRAAEIYYARAVHRINMLLYAALPIATMFLGVLIIGQVFPVLRILSNWMNVLGDVGG